MAGLNVAKDVSILMLAFITEYRGSNEIQVMAPQGAIA